MRRIVASVAMVFMAGMVVACGKPAAQPKPPAPFASKAAPAGAVQGSAPAAVASGSGAGGAMPTPPVAPAGLSTETSDASWMQCGSLEFPKPAAWVWVKPSAPFRTLQYRVPGEAELIVSVFPAGDGGAIDANIERWANQFGGAAGVKARSERMVGEVRVARVDFEGDYKGMGMAQAKPGMAQLGAIVQGPKQSVFVRLLGPKAAVEAARGAFDALVAGARAQP
jgi:hypothetical protein